MKFGGFAKRAMLSAALVALWASAGPSLAADAPVSLSAVEAPPQTVLSTHVLEAASAYRAYMRKAAATPSKFKNGHEIETSLADGAAYEPGQLSRGAVAFAALVALQDPAFVAGVRQYGIRPVDRKDLADKIIANPGYATVMPGAAGAASLIQAALAAEGSKVQTQGKAITQAARDIQLEAKWSKEPVKDRPARLAHAKTASAAPMAASDSDLQELRSRTSAWWIGPRPSRFRRPIRPLSPAPWRWRPSPRSVRAAMKTTPRCRACWTNPATASASTCPS
jgi:hypothetical protein